MNEYINLFTENSDSSKEVVSNETTSEEIITVGAASESTATEEETSSESTTEETTSEETSSVEGMGWHPENSLEVLPKAGVGMVVIFAIIGVIILATALLGKITSGKNK